MGASAKRPGAAGRDRGAIRATALLLVVGLPLYGRLPVTVGVIPRQTVDAQGVVVEMRGEAGTTAVYEHTTHLAPAFEFVRGQAETFRTEVALFGTDVGEATWYVRGRIVMGEGTADITSDWVKVDH